MIAMLGRRWKRVARWVSLIVLLGLAAILASCVRISGGTWLIREAGLPAGWPAATPVGAVQVKRYPAYRAAVARAGEPVRGEQGPVFRKLFRHIKQNDIAMTAPVEMGYETPEAGALSMASMAFMYRNSGVGRAGDDGPVSVRDVESQRMASLGVRGGYGDERIAGHVATLRAWLAAHADQWEAIGPVRLLGYNSPFIPAVMRYGEIQVPVRAVNAPVEGAR